MRKSFACLILCLILYGCSDKGSFRIIGNIQNHEDEYVSISRVEVNTPVRIDSAKIRKEGSFRFNIKASEPDFYQLGFSEMDFITLLAEPGEEITIKFTGKYMAENYEVSGSPGTSKIMLLDSALARTKLLIDSLESAYEKSAGRPGFREKEEEINNEFLRVMKEQRMFSINFILKNLASFASIKALYQKIDETTYVLYDSRDLQFLKLVSDTLSHYYPDSKQVKALKANLEKEMSALFTNRIARLSKDLPETKLDPSLKDINGRRINLSSFLGKYVLLTFWSATSEDCVRENLRFKDLYKKYKSKGFEIYQINLDLNEETWTQAVKFDELPWISVREDDPVNPRNAVLYNVRILPANYLYDKSGNIIGTNLHGRSLELKLAQIFDY